MSNETQYTLMNEGFARFASRVGEGFASAGIPYAITGNAAVQAHILDLTARKMQKTIPELAGDYSFTDLELLRPMNRVDVAIVGPESLEERMVFAKKVFGAERNVEGLVFDVDENGIFEWKLLRDGAKKATYSFETSQHQAPQTLALKVMYGPQDMNNFGASFYEDSIKGCRKIELPFGKNKTIPVNVMAPKYVIAAKIDRFEPQDAGDIASLSLAINRFGKGVHLPGIVSLLGKNAQPYIERAEHLLKMD